MPPRHIACRSITTAVTKSFRELGLDQDDYTPDQRASMDGQIAAPVNFEDWLRNQSEERQVAVLGATRAKLWREGKLDLQDFVRDGREVISLDELRRLHPDLDSAPIRPASPVAVATPPAPAPTTRPRAVAPDVAALDAAERDYVLDNGRRTGTEHLVAYDANTGALYQRSEGGRDYVNFSNDLTTALADGRNAIILHHNHPSSSSLSYQDMTIVAHQPGAHSIWAHGHNGSAYYAERGKFELKKRSVDAIGENLRSRLQKEINALRMAPHEASLIHNHLIWMAVHRIGQIVYRAELSGESLAIWTEHEALFREFLEELS